MDTSIDTSKITADKTRKRIPFVAFLFSLFSPGLGQIYNGQLKKGISLVIIFLLLPILYRLLGIPLFFYGFISIIIIQISFQVWIIIDAVKCSRKNYSYQLQFFNKWYYYLLFIILYFLTVELYSTQSILGIRSFSFTSSSMEPTLINNDKCVAQIFRSKDKTLDYGDIIIYQVPNDHTFYTGRIVGLAGDSLEIKNDFLLINSRESVTSLIEANSEGFENKLEIAETLPNSKIIHIYKIINAGSEVSNISKFKIPLNSYYIMGDNRNNSYDSRFRGPIHKEDIYGKFLYVFWEEKWNRINTDLTRE